MFETVIGFGFGLLIGWISMAVFLALTGNLRTREEQAAFLKRQHEIREMQKMERQRAKFDKVAQGHQYSGEEE